MFKLLLCFLMNLMGAIYTKIRSGNTEKDYVGDSSIIVKLLLLEYNNSGQEASVLRRMLLKVLLKCVWKKYLTYIII